MSIEEMKPCAVCGSQVAAQQMEMSEKGELCPACAEKEDARTAGGFKLHPVAIAGIVLGVIPFFIHVTSSSSVTSGGETTVKFIDYVALGGGGGAALAGILMVVMLVTRKASGGLNVAGLLACLGLAAYQLAYGLGVFAG